MPDAIDLNTVFAKTDLGQQEVQSKSLGLSLLVRRALVLVDGKRSGAELSVFMVGKGDIALILAELLALDCIEPVAARAGVRAPALADARPEPQPSEAPVTVPQTLTTDAVLIGGLPPPDMRNDKDNEMARNFMINSINSIIGHHTRISLVDDIFRARGTEGLRKVYFAWEASMLGHGAGARRLPELRDKLFKVL